MKAAADAHAALVKSLRDARDRERGARAALDGVLASSFAADFAALAADFPVVLLPVRVETRFLPEPRPGRGRPAQRLPHALGPER